MIDIKFTEKKFEELKDKSIVARIFNIFLILLYVASFGLIIFAWIMFMDCLYNPCNVGDENSYFIIALSSILLPLIFHYIKKYIIIPTIIYIIYGND